MILKKDEANTFYIFVLDSVSDGRVFKFELRSGGFEFQKIFGGQKCQV